ncbi:hypothetical protein ACQP2E_22935 [Actinoplanes sp. CA-015351]|uniref:hypothetical protein n=1 Tax=Actinoplanes sp. CA-015351 TaxID=3239897 RepID=UPI003D972A2C
MIEESQPPLTRQERRSTVGAMPPAFGAVPARSRRGAAHPSAVDLGEFRGAGVTQFSKIGR